MNHPLHRRNRAFTLIEVLLVLAILVIIAGFAVINIGPIKRSADKRAAKAGIAAFETALDAYSLDVGMYPTTNEGLQALRYPPADIPNPTAWAGPYLKRDIPLDPWNRPYIYVYPGRHNPDSYDVYSLGPYGQDGTPDNIGNWPDSVGN